eukprot:comp19028_c0_seq1/m.21426 comp19028_c0_seq1/g.21426  ORF comp19028_c0_seq1/g.21426 comp19028_c0_seq1/m.21426 type:complete len:359 (-) comp19028_c0_seq1:45-1121(-)
MRYLFLGGSGGTDLFPSSAHTRGAGTSDRDDDHEHKKKSKWNAVSLFSRPFRKTVHPSTPTHAPAVEQRHPTGRQRSASIAVSKQRDNTYPPTYLPLGSIAQDHTPPESTYGSAYDLPAISGAESAGCVSSGSHCGRMYSGRGRSMSVTLAFKSISARLTRTGSIEDEDRPPVPLIIGGHGLGTSRPDLLVQCHALPPPPYVETLLNSIDSGHMAAKQEFFSFLSEEHSRESVLFYYKCLRLQRRVSDGSAKLFDAIELYREFVCEDAKHQINIPSHIKSKLDCAIEDCRVAMAVRGISEYNKWASSGEESDPDEKFDFSEVMAGFNNARIHLIEMLQKDSYRRFLAKRMATLTAAGS